MPWLNTTYETSQRHKNTKSQEIKKLMWETIYTSEHQLSKGYINGVKWNLYSPLFRDSRNTKAD